ncbi:MAG: hypothetical protein ACI4M3_08510 [Acutalibacteraceae bacterium]
MQFVKGKIVQSKAGHDKGMYCVVVSVEGNFAYICDGKRRKLENPKKKKLIHLAPTGILLEESMMQTDKQIRRSLSKWNGNDGSSI